MQEDPFPHIRDRSIDRSRCSLDYRQGIYVVYHLYTLRANRCTVTVPECDHFETTRTTSALFVETLEIYLFLSHDRWEIFCTNSLNSSGHINILVIPEFYLFVCNQFYLRTIEKQKSYFLKQSRLVCTVNTCVQME